VIIFDHFLLWLKAYPFLSQSYRSWFYIGACPTVFISILCVSILHWCVSHRWHNIFNKFLSIGSSSSSKYGFHPTLTITS